MAKGGEVGVGTFNTLFKVRPHFHIYDKQTKAIDFRALAQKNKLKILELKDATSICRRDMSSFNSRILSWIFEQGPENL